MYAVIFDIDTNFLNEINSNLSSDIYINIRQFMEKNRFIWQQGNLYFGESEKINAVSCVRVVQRLAKEYEWFSTCVKDIKMLRIDEVNDLMMAIKII